MISHKHRFIFVHITKTAGTSIEKVLHDETCRLLSGEWDPDRVQHTPLNHLTLQELADYGLLTPAQLRSYFKFCFVRNPWDRLISEIYCPWMHPWFKDLTVEQRIRHACERAVTGKGIANHLRVQHDFVSAEGLQMDFIGRFERLEEDFGYLCWALGIEASLPHLNRSSLAPRPYQDYYEKETQALVAATYRRDIETFQYQFEEPPASRVVVHKALHTVDDRAKSPGLNRVITAYPLHGWAAPLHPADPDARRGAVLASWELLCPTAFEATWNGGPRPEDIQIRCDGADPDQLSFVQSQLGEGRLTFYPGYQFKTGSELVLWVRGPINAPKNGIAPLEQIVDTTLLPCTLAVHWQFTRPHQTIRFAAGEPFATLLLYPKTGLEDVNLEVVQREDDEAAYEQAFQQMVDAPALHDVPLRLGAAPVASGAND